MNNIHLLQNADNYVLQYLNSKKIEYLQIAITEYTKILESIDITDYLLIDSDNELLPKNVYIESYFKLGTFYKMMAESNIRSKKEMNSLDEELFKKAISCLLTVKRIDIEHESSIKQLVSIYTQLTYYNQHDLIKALHFLNEAMVISPHNANINYNLGFIYQKLNKLELSITHYQLAIFTNKFTIDENDKLINYVNCYNGISCIYRSIKQFPESLHYLLKAYNILPTEPSINNQLGVVYTEMRRTDLALPHYNKAIEYHDKPIIEHSQLLSEIYLNMGHMYSYNGDNLEAINCYNKSLKLNPTFLLPFQNKIFNLCYLYNDLENKLDLTNQHKNINKILKPSLTLKKKEKGKKTKIRLGFVSGDLLDHPVSFFISTFLNNYNKNLFDIYCYSEVIIDINRLPRHLKINFIRNKTTKEVCEMIQNDDIDILFDLSGHTAFNRMDVFINKPSYIQISYIGYPYTTGLTQIDYRITDNI